MKRHGFADKKYLSQAFGLLFFLVLGALILFPAAYTLCNSFMSPSEIGLHYATAMGQAENAGAAFPGRLLHGLFEVHGLPDEVLAQPVFVHSHFRRADFCQHAGGIRFCEISRPWEEGYPFSADGIDDDAGAGDPCPQLYYSG